MSDIQDKIKELESLEQEIQSKKEELEKIKEETEDYEKKKMALEEEHKRVLNELKVAREEKNKAKEMEESFQEKFRKEQLEKAKNKFFSEFEYKSDEEKQMFLDTFNKLDSGSVDADLIYKDLVRAHLYLNPDKYLSLEKNLSKLTNSAESLNINLSTQGFAGVDASMSANEPVELTKEDLLAIQWSGISKEQYIKLKKEGRI
jgi:uncharacterized protein (DUF3084 family)